MSKELVPKKSSPVAGSTKTSHNQPKQPVLRIPKPVQSRVIVRHISGESNRLIAAEEGLDRSTVSRILSRQEVTELIAHYQTRLLELVPKALSAYEEVFASDNLPLKAATATKLLESVGALPKPGTPLSANQPAAADTERKQQRLLVLGGMTEMMLAKSEKFGTPLPPGFADTPDDPKS